MGDAQTQPGDIVSVPLFLDNVSTNDIGWVRAQFCYDDDEIEIVSMTAGAGLASLNGGAGPAMMSPNFQAPPAGRGTLAVR